MKKIQLEIPISRQFNEGPLKLQQQSLSFEIELQEGIQQFQSESIKVGTFHHFDVFTHIVIPYEYDAQEENITIAGTDEVSNQQITLVSSLEGSSQMMNKQKMNSIAENETHPNMLSYFISSNSSVKNMKQLILREFIEQLTDQLVNKGKVSVIKTGMAPIITPHNYEDYHSMLFPDKETPNTVSLDDIFEVQTALQSQYEGTITINDRTQTFANVIGSSSDTLPSGAGSWIKLWNDKCNNGHYPKYCSSYNYVSGKYHNGYCNGYTLIGGHIIKGRVAKRISPGTKVYIFPICHNHNMDDYNYMVSHWNPEGVVLKNYKQ